jgi:hypothetical protein
LRMEVQMVLWAVTGYAEYLRSYAQVMAQAKLREKTDADSR